LLVRGVLAIAVILNRAVAYFRCLQFPPALATLVETYESAMGQHRGAVNETNEITRTETSI
jgi:hypothetical protein